MGDEFVERTFVQAQLGHEVTSIAFEAFSVAMRARTSGQGGQIGRPDTRGLTLDVVDALRVRAEQLLPRGDDLRAAIFAFATMYDVHHRDPAAVVKLGEALDAAVTAIISPAPPERFRADIDG